MSTFDIPRASAPPREVFRRACKNSRMRVIMSPSLTQMHADSSEDLRCCIDICHQSLRSCLSARPPCAVEPADQLNLQHTNPNLSGAAAAPLTPSLARRRTISAAVQANSSPVFPTLFVEDATMGVALPGVHVLMTVDISNFHSHGSARDGLS